MIHRDESFGGSENFQAPVEVDLETAHPTYNGISFLLFQLILFLFAFPRFEIGPGGEGSWRFTESTGTSATKFMFNMRISMNTSGSGHDSDDFGD